MVIPKPAGDIHLCIDMTRANDVKVLERLPIATVDGGTKESKWEYGIFQTSLLWGFHQIELDSSSRGITVFVTDDGTFRNQRLSFGINAAPEKYQQIIAYSTAGLKVWLTLLMILLEEMERSMTRQTNTPLLKPNNRLNLNYTNVSNGINTGRHEPPWRSIT